MEVLPKMELNRGAADVLEVLLPSLIFKCCLQWNSIGVLPCLKLYRVAGLQFYRGAASLLAYNSIGVLQHCWPTIL